VIVRICTKSCSKETEKGAQPPAKEVDRNDAEIRRKRRLIFLRSMRPMLGNFVFPILFRESTLN
jgi:hypothetical protein